MTVNFDNYRLIIDEEFDGSSADLNLYDGTSGLWSTEMQRGDRVHNSRFSLFGDPDLTDAEGNPLGLDPFTVEDGVLSINVSRIDPDQHDDIQAVLDQSPYIMAGAQDASEIDYLTGMLSLPSELGRQLRLLRGARSASRRHRASLGPLAHQRL